MENMLFKKNHFSNANRGYISNQNKLSILEGYKETFIFSYKIFNLLSIYIILLKLFLNFYSRIQIKKI